jgi:hypothetical protein
MLFVTEIRNNLPERLGADPGVGAEILFQCSFRIQIPK